MKKIWKKIKLLSKFLGVSGDDLLETGFAPNEKVPAGDGKHSVSDDDIKFALWGDCEDMDDDDLADVRRYAAFVRERKKDRK